MTLVLASDYGASAFKGLTSDLESLDSPKVLLIPPHLLKVPNSKGTNDYCGNPLDKIVVGYGSKFYALGAYAAEHGATPILKDLKTLHTVPRTLAAVWVAAQELQLAQTFDLYLSCVLPPGEYGERESFRVELIKALRNFQTPSGKYQVNLKTFKCRPEGAGVFNYYQHRRSKDKDGLSGIKVGVLMLGHRNVSFFWSRDDRMSGFASSDLGFSLLVNQVKLRTIDYKDLPLAKAIASYLTTNDEATLEAVLMNSSEALKDKERKRLAKVITEQGGIYLDAIFQWIGEKIDLGEIQEFVLAGGGCDPLRPALVSYLEKRLPIAKGRDRPGIFLHGGMDIPNDLQIPEGQNRERFADVYGLWIEDLLPSIQTNGENNDD